eukprot:3379794-Amphidinium_carterae.1
MAATRTSLKVNTYLEIPIPVGGDTSVPSRGQCSTGGGVDEGEGFEAEMTVVMMTRRKRRSTTRIISTQDKKRRKRKKSW